MKHMTILILCLFLISISVAFAADPAELAHPEQKIDTEAAEEGELMQEARELPSTLITDEEEQSSVMKEIDKLKEGYVYDEDPHE